ncbi:TATA-binding protein-associated factor 2N-like [Polyodon spathula]|uniref:TATA-binding protein-associated factor 2N-like n=1 Tax=Polyodon spathula TaxID=7913 RepID=UPI001B7F6938|nr:TATA-binding protein-associated factor 2N-like [Polyodon spathula]
MERDSEPIHQGEPLCNQDSGAQSQGGGGGGGGEERGEGVRERREGGRDTEEGEGVAGDLEPWDRDQNLGQDRGEERGPVEDSERGEGGGQDSAEYWGESPLQGPDQPPWDSGSSGTERGSLDELTSIAVKQSDCYTETGDREGGVRDSETGDREGGVRDSETGDSETGDREGGVRDSETGDSETGDREGGVRDSETGDREGGVRDSVTGDREGGIRDSVTGDREGGVRDMLTGDREGGVRDSETGDSVTGDSGLDREEVSDPAPIPGSPEPSGEGSPVFLAVGEREEGRRVQEQEREAQDPPSSSPEETPLTQAAEIFAAESAGAAQGPLVDASKGEGQGEEERAEPGDLTPVMYSEAPDSDSADIER